MRGSQFAEMSAFAVIAEQGSFAKAATLLGIGRSTLSQNLRSLEERLGVRLLNRTTRSVSLTEAGARLLARVRPALDELGAAAGEAIDQRQKTSGLLRLAVQPPVADFMIGPMLARFMRAYPAVQLDVAVVKMPGDIVKEGFDAGIRFGEQVERDMVAIRVMGEARFLVVGSPDYLRRHAPPTSPRDLRDHDCIRNRLPNGAIFGWDFSRNGRVVHAAVTGRLIVNDIDLSIRAVLDGLGLAYLLRDYIADDLAAGRLVPVLQDWTPSMSGFFLYHSSRRRMTAPLQAFIDFVKQEAKRRGVAPAAPPRAGVRPNYRLVGASRR
ncbi:MAG: LysR family transcriptional regulator [Pseudolabrys sp.]